ncbi:MAG: helix-turn-helix domain-containing protein [Thermoleophilaceae bacterium]
MTSEPSPAEARVAAAVRAAAKHNYTAERALRALEVIVLRPSTAPTVAREIGISDRTARRILETLVREEYVERHGGRGRAGREFVPTVRLLAMAAQLAARLPLIERSRRTVREIAEEAQLAAYIVVPCYERVVLIAGSGEDIWRPWATLPACSDASGQVLLAHRERWRRSLAEAGPDLSIGEREAARIVEQGHVLVAPADGIGSLAVAVVDREQPIAALALRGSRARLVADEGALAELLTRAAAELAKTDLRSHAA